MRASGRASEGFFIRRFQRSPQITNWRSESRTRIATTGQASGSADVCGTVGGLGLAGVCLSHAPREERKKIRAGSTGWAAFAALVEKVKSLEPLTPTTRTAGWASQIILVVSKKLQTSTNNTLRAGDLARLNAHCRLARKRDVRSEKELTSCATAV
jgi:hypothetical protein